MGGARAELGDGARPCRACRAKLLPLNPPIVRHSLVVVAHVHQSGGSGLGVALGHDGGPRRLDSRHTGEALRHKGRDVAPTDVNNRLSCSGTRCDWPQ